MNGTIDKSFWDTIDQDHKNDLVFKALLEINAKLDFRYKLFMSIAVILGFIGGIVGHIGEGCFKFLGIIKP